MWFFAYLGNDQDLNTIQNQFKKNKYYFSPLTCYDTIPPNFALRLTIKINYNDKCSKLV